MLSRWVICPWVFIGGARHPRVALYGDPGRELRSSERAGNATPARPGYSFSAADGGTVAVCYVRGEDFTPLDNDDDIVDLFADDTANIDRFESKRWVAYESDPDTRHNRVTLRSKLSTRLAHADLDRIEASMDGTDAEMRDVLAELGKHILGRSEFNPHGYRA